MATQRPLDTQPVSPPALHSSDMISMPPMTALPTMTSRHRFEEIPPTMSEDDRGLLLSCLAQISCIRMECGTEATTSAGGNMPDLHTLIDVPTPEEMRYTVEPVLSHTPATQPPPSHTVEPVLSHTPGPQPQASHTVEPVLSHTPATQTPPSYTVEPVLSHTPATQSPVSHTSQRQMSDISSPRISDISHTSFRTAGVSRSRSEHHQPSSTPTSSPLFPLTPMSPPFSESSVRHTTVSFPQAVTSRQSSSFSQPTLSNTTISSFPQLSSFPTSSVSHSTIPSFPRTTSSETSSSAFQVLPRHCPRLSLQQSSLNSPVSQSTTDVTASSTLPSVFPSSTSTHHLSHMDISSPPSSLYTHTATTTSSSSFSHPDVNLPLMPTFPEADDSRSESVDSEALSDEDIAMVSHAVLEFIERRGQQDIDPSLPRPSTSGQQSPPLSILPLVSDVGAYASPHTSPLSFGHDLAEVQVRPTGPVTEGHNPLVPREGQNVMVPVHQAAWSQIGAQRSLEQLENPDVLRGQGHRVAPWMYPGDVSSFPIQYPHHTLAGCQPIADPRPEPGTTSQEGQPRLWKFVWDVLEDPRYNPELITWVSRPEGIFRLTDPGRLAEFWGHVKGNRSMNYEKLSRGLRYYYTYNVLEHVPGKLVYKFGQGATQVMQCLAQSSPTFSDTSYYQPNTSPQ